jgi:hypothetical protein
MYHLPSRIGGDVAVGELGAVPAILRNCSTLLVGGNNFVIAQEITILICIYAYPFYELY